MITTMGTGRLEAFSDGVLAIIITIMVLELRVPHGSDLMALKPVLPVLLCYLLSYIYVGIYWNNHHHLMVATGHISGGVLWANLHLLFWLSLIPFVTGWMGENRFAAMPTALYGMVLLMAAIAYWLLQHAILVANGPDSVLAKALKRDLKGTISPMIYAAAILAALAVSPWVAQGLYALVAFMWLAPDPRIEKAVADNGIAVPETQPDIQPQDAPPDA